MAMAAEADRVGRLAMQLILALHYQNENCHPNGKIKVGIAQDAAWREERLRNARRLFDGARANQVPIIHVRLAVPPDYRGVTVNTPLIAQWVELGAWQEGSWGVEFIEDLAPIPGELVVSHTRNSAFHQTNLLELVRWHGATQLICCGVSTAYAVEGTVREATDYGFAVTVAADACSTATQEQHKAALRAMELIARVETVDGILGEWSAG